LIPTRIDIFTSPSDYLKIYRTLLTAFATL
jgi:hypothetical protein